MAYPDTELLTAALRGFQHQASEIQSRIDDITRRLGGNRLAASSVSSQGAQRRPQRTHRISPEGRARIAAAQKRRWAQAKAAGRNNLKGRGSKAQTAAGSQQ
jgi:hypothetical protein